MFEPCPLTKIELVPAVVDQRARDVVEDLVERARAQRDRADAGLGARAGAAASSRPRTAACTARRPCSAARRETSSAVIVSVPSGRCAPCCSQRADRDQDDVRALLEPGDVRRREVEQAVGDGTAVIRHGRAPGRGSGSARRRRRRTPASSTCASTASNGMSGRSAARSASRNARSASGSQRSPPSASASEKPRVGATTCTGPRASFSRSATIRAELGLLLGASSRTSVATGLWK